MKGGKTLVQLAQEIERRQELKKDYIVDTARVEAVAKGEPGMS